MVLYQFIQKKAIKSSNFVKNLHYDDYMAVADVTDNFEKVTCV